MKNFISLLTFVILFCVPFTVTAQSLEINIEDLPFEVTTGGIIGISQDQKGNLWLASSSEGLFKYDGTKLTEFSTGKDNNATASNRLECIEITDDGMIWIGSFANGLYRLDPNKEEFTEFTHNANNQKSVRSNDIKVLEADGKKGLWVGTASGLDYLDFESMEFVHSFIDSPEGPVLAKEHIRTLYKDKSDVLWIGCGSPFLGEETTGGLFKLDQKKAELRKYIHTNESNSLIDNRVSAIFEDSQGTFWIGTAGDGLHTMNKQEGTFIRHTHDPLNKEKLSRPSLKSELNYGVDHIRFIKEDNKGFIWIGTFQNGLNRYDPSTGKVQHFGSEESDEFYLPSDAWWDCLLGKDGLIWLLSWGLSTETLNTNLFQANVASNRIKEISVNRWVHCFTEDSKGNIYLGTNGELLRLDSNEKVEVVLIFEEQLNTANGLADIEKDKLGNFWISSAYGLHYFNPETRDLETFMAEDDGEGGLLSDGIRSTSFYNDDSLFVGTDEGLYIFDLKPIVS